MLPMKILVAEIEDTHLHMTGNRHSFVVLNPIFKLNLILLHFTILMIYNLFSLKLNYGGLTSGNPAAP